MAKPKAILNSKKELKKQRKEAFYKVYHFLENHPAFEGEFLSCFDIEVVKVNPLTNCVDDEINYNICSGVENAFNIGRKWITTMPIECYVESTGVYPIDWSTEELVTLQTLDENGEIIIMIAPAKR